MVRRSFSAPLLTAAILAAWSGHVAHAQNALGSGHALDANQKAGSGGINTQVHDYYSDFALRNAIVTGNVPGGSYFRANVGYSASGDFRGRTGGDTVFSFERSSFFSGLAARDVRGITGLQMQMNVPTFGQLNELGLIISRPGAGATSAQLSPNMPSVPTLDPFDSLQGSLRSTSAFMIRQSDRPTVIGQRDLGNGTIMPLAASSLFGVRPLAFENVALSGPVDVEAAPRRFTDPRDALRGPIDPETGRPVRDGNQQQEDEPAAPALTQHQQLLQSLRAATDKIDLRVDARMNETAEDSMNPPTEPTVGAEDPLDEPDATGRVPDRPDFVLPDDTGSPDDAAPATDSDPLDAALRRLTESLAVRPSDGKSSDNTDEEDESDETVRPFDPLDPLGRRADAMRPGTTADQDNATQDRTVLSPELAMLVEALSAEEFRLRSFAPEGVETVDIFDLHMRNGERALRDGRWMDAEERYSVALTMRPGDAMAALGRIHAQIGAGLLRSAASNLRDLMRAYPELAGAQVDPSLLPPAPRLDRIVSTLELHRQRRGVAWMDASLLSAYVAYLLNDRVGLVQAFDDLARAEKAAGAAPDPVHTFLERVWMGIDKLDLDDAALRTKALARMPILRHDARRP